MINVLLDITLSLASYIGKGSLFPFRECGCYFIQQSVAEKHFVCVTICVSWSKSKVDKLIDEHADIA